MRLFEVVLILVNMLSLVLSFRKQSKAAWAAAAGLNLSAFLIHGLTEGFRYQMAFSYVFVILFVVLAFVKTRDRFIETRTPTGLKLIAIALASVFLLLTSFLAYALPVFTLPKPTGTYNVGIQYFHLVDEKRKDPFVDPSNQKRELMVKVYYPAEEDDSKPFSPYFHNSRALIRLFAAFYNLPDFMFDHLTLVKTNSKEDLRLSEKEPSYPVILFSHGAGTTMEVQTSQSEDLASHGYIVMTIDHPYVSAATVFPDRIVSAKEATANFNTVEPAEIITQIMADDATFVIDKLSDMNAGKIDSTFAGKLNLEQIGVIGHSVGGAVAYNLALNDRRVKAAINLDGRVFIAPKENSAQMDRFLMLAGDNGHIQSLQQRESLFKKFEDMREEDQQMMIFMYGSQQAYEEAYTKAQQNVIGLIEVLKSSGNLYTIQGSDHMKFTDIDLIFGSKWLREQINIRGETGPARCLEITKAVTVTFFDRHLKGDTQGSVENLVQEYQELIKEEWQ